MLNIILGELISIQINNMKKKSLISYWNNYYGNVKILKESSFAKFTMKFIGKNRKEKKIIDIGCGNGRDSFYFYKKKLSVLGVDISRKIIKNNSIYSTKKIKFKNFDIEKNTLTEKFDFIYSRFFLHAISEVAENKLFRLINKIKKKKTLVFFEFRNKKDPIFKNIKLKKNNKLVEFEKGHFRRIIDDKKFLKKIKTKLNCKIKYNKSSKNLSIVKNDNPNLTRIILEII